MVIYHTAETELGCLLVVKNTQGVCAIALDDNEANLLPWCQSVYPQAQRDREDSELQAYLQQLCRYIQQPIQPLDFPLDIQGTAFQQQVWQALLRIPVGEQRSYSELAQMVGKPTAVRAVASACAANLLALAIPCHRIVKKDGGLSGYRWGHQRKQRLLEKEQAAVSH